MTDERPDACWLALLGPTGAWSDAGVELALGGPKQRAVFATLLAEPNRVVSVDRIIDNVWGDSAASTAASTVQVYVHNLRRVLEPASAVALVTRRPGYVLEVEPAKVDHLIFEASVSAAAAARDRGHHADALRHFDAALALWRGRALDDLVDNDWAMRTADRFGERRIQVTEERNDTALAAGAHDGLVASIEEQVREYPVREQLWAQLMVALYRSGRQRDALAAYGRIRTILLDELGLDPGPVLRDLEAAILRQDASITVGTGRPVANVATHASASRPLLPEPLTPLVGRHRALADLHAAVDGSTLVTVVGPPGIGKTRLALEVARQRASAGVRCAYVDLSLVEAGDEATRVIADGLRSLEGEAGPSLLVVDGCEHVAHRVAASLTSLSSYDGLHVLVTSQLPLASPRERVFSLSPLDLPDASAVATGAENDAVRLFEARARAVAPGFAVDEGNALAVQRVVTILAGIPLAIELAAAQVRALSVEELARQLDESLDLLVAPGAPLGDRHRTLGDAMAWSLAALDVDAHAVLRALCAFAGPFSLADAVAVCGADDPALVGTIVRLVDRSLLSLARDAAGGVRYRVLEPVRRIVVLGSGARETAARAGQRHAEHFTALATATSPLDPRWQPTMDAIADNVAAALRFSVVSADTALAVRAAICLSTYYRRRGAAERAAAALGAVLPMVPSLAPPDAIDVLLAAGSLAVERDDCAAAGEMANDAVQRARVLGDARREAHAHVVAAQSHRQMGLRAAARESLQLALGLFDAAADVNGTAVALGQLGILQRLDGDAELAEGLLEQGLARLSSVRGAASGWTVADMATQQRGRSFLLTEMGTTAALRGRMDSAGVFFTESLLVSAAADHARGIAATLEAIAALVAQRREPAAAATLLGAARHLAHADESLIARPQVARLQAAIVAELGLEEWDRRWSAGRQLTIDQAVRLGLDVVGRSPGPQREDAST